MYDEDETMDHCESVAERLKTDTEEVDVSLQPA